jgi:peptidyl-prolyl cis-trans isomerase C
VKNIAIAALFLLAAGSAAPAWSAPGDVVAKVNGHEITESELTFAEAEIGSELTGVPEENRRRVLVEYLIEAHLMADAAEKAKLTEGEAFEARMKYYRLRALRDAYFESQIRDSVPEADAKELYDERVKNLPAEEEVKASHILVKTEEEAKQVAEKLEKGGDFAALAKEHSQDRGGANGGDLGYFSRGQMVKPFEDAAFAMQKDKLSDPVKTQFGWHIIKVEDKRNRQPPSFEEVKDQITASLIQTKLRGSVSDLRKEGTIEFVDPELKKAAEAAEAAKAAQGAAGAGAQVKPDGAAEAKSEEAKTEEDKKN